MRARSRRPEGPDGPEVVTVPVLLGGEDAGREAPDPLVRTLVSAETGEHYHHHSVSYPEAEVIFEALVAAEHPMDGGRAIWAEVARKVKAGRWRST